MSSDTRKINALGDRMTFAELLDAIQHTYRGVTVTGVANMLDIPPNQLRMHAFADLPMDSRAASKLSNRIRYVLGDMKVSRRKKARAK